MNKQAKLKEQFLSEPLTIRLGALATNLARIDAYIADTENASLVRHLVDESRFFIDWIAPSLSDFEQQYKLAQYQRQLAEWLHQWAAIWVDPVRRMNIATEVNRWSEQVWQISGLRDTVGVFAASPTHIATN